MRFSLYRCFLPTLVSWAEQHLFSLFSKRPWLPASLILGATALGLPPAWCRFFRAFQADDTPRLKVIQTVLRMRDPRVQHPQKTNGPTTRLPLPLPLSCQGVKKDGDRSRGGGLQIWDLCSRKLFPLLWSLGWSKGGGRFGVNRERGKRGNACTQGHLMRMRGAADGSGTALTGWISIGGAAVGV